MARIKIVRLIPLTFSLTYTAVFYLTHSVTIGKLSRQEKNDPKMAVDWTRVFELFKNAITVRRYSWTTLRTYFGWVRKIQSTAYP